MPIPPFRNEGPTVYPGRDPDNADWPKRSWDLRASNIEELRAHLRPTGMSFEAFKRLSVYRWHVDRPGFEWLREL